MLDLFPVSLYREKSVRRFEIAYVAETFDGDSLHFFVDRDGADCFNVEIRKNGTEVVARSRMVMQDRKRQ